MKFDDDEANEQVFETVTRDQSDVHVRVINNHFPMDDVDYPKNPFGDRDMNSSLYFDDGLRSVDYVLVWKNLLPVENDEAMKEKELEDIKRKEAVRAEKREVFEENLMSEGLELEKYVVDDEIYFIKIHAPLEVLRRYAEILKLRLPMKMVS